MSDSIQVFSDHLGAEPILVGTLHPQVRRGVFTKAVFSYSNQWIADSRAYPLEPNMPLRSGVSTPSGDLAVAGCFGDSAPDSWGRQLIGLRNRRTASHTRETPRTLTELDYLLGARDDARQGCLRYAMADRPGHFLAAEHDGIPYLVHLGDLVNHADSVERGTATDEAINALLHAGSSLGGARPKAHVRLHDGGLAIAKFPSVARDTEFNIIRWEAVTLTLARHAGIQTPGFELVAVPVGRGSRSVIVLRRFDRRQTEGAVQRIGYVSAMTMLEARDRDVRSYIELVEVIETQGEDVDAQLEELWRRVAFTILVNNTDDHLRNHGFLLTDRNHWVLSPVFDVNPTPDGSQLSTGIDLNDDCAADIRNHFQMGLQFYRLTNQRAGEILTQVLGATARWRYEATRQGVDNTEIEQMAPAFENSRHEHARALIS